MANDRTPVDGETVRRSAFSRAQLQAPGIGSEVGPGPEVAQSVTAVTHGVVARSDGCAQA
jgi:hypothetical protein